MTVQRRVGRSVLAVIILACMSVSLSAQSPAPRIAAYVQARPGQAAAQRAEVRPTITLRLEAVPLEAALQEIARQAGVRLIYSRESLAAERPVSLVLVDAQIEEAFDRVLRGTELEARASLNGRVVIARRPAVALATSAAETPLRPLSAVEVPPAPRTTGASTRAARMAAVVRGRVTEAGSGRPLNGAQVVLLGTGRGGLTGAGGDFLLVNVPAGRHTLRAQLIGYTAGEQTIEVLEGRTTVADFALSPAAVELDALVVTGTPGGLARRAVGNAVTRVDAAELTERMSVKTVAELLKAQAPGLTILSSSGTPGAAGTIQIRGQSSLSAGLQPVVYVDGVRIHAGAAGSFRNDWRQAGQPAQQMTGAGGAAYGSGQEASALSMINPEDIESIEVIKGPAAATLYGAEAANGVIQIITKKGRYGEQKLQWNGRVQLGRTAWALERGTSYTLCTPERIAARNPNAPAEPIWPGCQQVAPNTVISASPLALPGVLRDGENQHQTLSVRGGGEQYSFYANLSRDVEQGVERNSSFQRTSARANFAFNPLPELDFSVNFNYVRDRTQFPQGNNAGNLIESAWSFVPGARGLSRGQLTDDFLAESQAMAVYENWLRGDRIVFGTTLNYRPVPSFANRLTVGGDIATRESERWVAPGSRWGPSDGQLTLGSPKNTVFTLDYAGTLHHERPGGLSSALSFGAQYSNSQYENTVAQGTGFVSAATRAIRFARDNNGWMELAQVKTLGFYLQEQLGWRNRLFATGALRMDNSSVFGEDINRIVYPKLSLSYVVSEEPWAARLGWMEQLRLRAAWGEAGNAPGPFAALQTYTFLPTTDPLTGQRGVALVRNTKGNPDVRPERGSELEAGLDAGFLGNRLGLELTYYRKRTRDALIPVPIPASEGYLVPTYLANIGEIRNTGVELALNATPVQARWLTWDARLGFSTNHNELVDFGQENPAIPFGLTAAVQRNVEGYPLGGYWVRDPVLKTGGDPTRPDDYEGGDLRYLGPSAPTRSASLANTWQLPGGLSLYLLLDYKGGNYLYNHTRQRRCALGICREVNDPARSAAERARLTTDIQANTALYTERADFVKLRDLSLTYVVPQALTQRLGSNRAALTLAAHNLGFLYQPYSGLDPETNFVGINDPGAEWAGVRVDYWNQPMFRRVTLSLDVNF